MPSRPRWRDPRDTLAQTLRLPIIPSAPLPPSQTPTRLMDAVRDAENELTQELPKLTPDIVRAVEDYCTTNAVPAELTEAPKRIIAAMGGFEPAATKPARRLSVRLFRAARDMARSRQRWCDEADARLRAQDARIAEFSQRWQHDDAHWEQVAAALKAKQDASDAGRIVVAYEDGGTSAALYTVDALAHEISQRALAGSGVSR